MAAASRAAALEPAILQVLNPKNVYDWLRNYQPFSSLSGEAVQEIAEVPVPLHAVSCPAWCVCILHAAACCRECRLRGLCVLQIAVACCVSTLACAPPRTPRPPRATPGAPLPAPPSSPQLMKVQLVSSGKVLQRVGFQPEAFIVVRQGVVRVQDRATMSPGDRRVTGGDAGPGGDAADVPGPTAAAACCDARARAPHGLACC